MDKKISLKGEVWMPVKGYKDGFYDGLYEVSNKGRFKQLPRRLNCKGGSRLTKEKIVWGSNSHGYRRVILKRDRIRLQIDIHVLVAKAFIPNPENKKTVNHKDAVRHHNFVENLEWATMQEQINHYHNMGLHWTTRGIERESCKLNEEKVKEIKKLYANEKISHRKLAEKFNVSYSLIGNILRNKKWKHVA